MLEVTREVSVVVSKDGDKLILSEKTWNMAKTIVKYYGEAFDMAGEPIASNYMTYMFLQLDDSYSFDQAKIAILAAIDDHGEEDDH